MRTLETIIAECGGNKITSVYSTNLNRWCEVDIELTQKIINTFAALQISHISVECRDYRIGELAGLTDNEMENEMEPEAEKYIKLCMWARKRYSINRYIDIEVMAWEKYMS